MDSASGEVYLLFPGTTSVGRHRDADLNLADAQVARRHARFHARAEPNEVDVQPIFPHAVYVNGCLLQGAQTLLDEDNILIGRVLLRYRSGSPA